MTQTGTFQLDFEADMLRKLLPFSGDSPPIYIPVRFASPFSSVPVVVLGVSGFRGGGDAFKFKLEPKRITLTGFEVMLLANKSWIDSIDVSWLATDA